MKTTIEIGDALLNEAKALAGRRKVTLRTLVEEGLRLMLERSKSRGAKFRLPKASFKGGELQPKFRGEDWSSLRDEIYRGRGT